MNRDRTNIAAVVAVIAGLCAAGAAIAYANWQSSQAGQAAFSNAFVSDVSNGMVSGSETAPATWPTAALGIGAAIMVLFGAGLFVAAWVTSND
jgi:hypothetical protein